MTDDELGSAVAQALEGLSALARGKPALRRLLACGAQIGPERPIAAALELVRAWRAHDVRRRGERPAFTRGHTESIDYRVPNASPRKLAAFAARCEALVTEASEVFGVELANVRELGTVARAYQELHERDPSARRLARFSPPGRARNKLGGRKLAPETPIADALDVILEPIPAEERRELIGALVAEWFGTKNTSAEQVRSRLKDYRRSHEQRRPRNLP